jgi:flagellar motility protein MotE (MotC chaperone)
VTTTASSKSQAAKSTAAAPQSSSVGDTASERRLSKVFTAMEPKQAAKVLEHMTDGDIHIILGYVGPRQAASIMAELPPERVAALSKLAMQGKGK